MPRDIDFERRMSDTEALMWALEQDPVLRSTFANVTFYDRPPDPERFRARMELASATVPRLRQRVADSVAGLSNPEWVEDPAFDLDHHVRRLAVPPPGDERSVLDLAALLSGDPFDRGRPLWQFTLVEGLEDGRGAMVQKLHHTITDGEGGVRLSTKFIDVERDPATPLDGGRVEPGSPPPEASHRSAAEAVRETVGDGLRRPLDLARRAFESAVDTLTHPSTAPTKAGEAVETARSVLRQVAVTEPARSPLWTERSLKRHLEVLSVPLDSVKAAAAGLGGTVNDLFVTAAAGAAGAYHRAEGSPVDELRMAMPVSTRASGSGASNAFAPTRMLVPVGIEDPAARFAAVQGVLRTTRDERAVGVASSLTGVLAALPLPVLVLAARQQVGTVDFTTSNVRGAPVELFMAGARILANYPIGPMAGTAFNLTTLSYNGRLDMGCVVDAGAVADPPLLRRCLVESFDELLAAGANRSA